MAKKKRSPEEMHRQIQDALQVLPYAIDKERKEGRRTKAFMLQYVSAPLLRVMNRMMGAGRYRGAEGPKRRQAEQMRRHLQHKQEAVRQVQTMIETNAKSRKKKRI